MKPKRKLKKSSPKDLLIEYSIVGMCGTLSMYVAWCLRFGGFAYDVVGLLILLAFGVLGGIFSHLISIIFKKDIIFLRSWLVVGILIAIIPSILFFSSSKLVAFVYGYVASLLWEARQSGLPDK